MAKKMAKKDDRLNIRINSQLKKEFEEYTEKMGYTQSGLIERLIREELERAKKKEVCLYENRHKS